MKRFWTYWRHSSATLAAALGLSIALAGSPSSAQVTLVVKESVPLRIRDISVNGFAVSPDGKILAAVGGSDAIALYSLEKGAWLKSLGDHAKFSKGVAISPDGKTLAAGTGGDHGTSIGLWDIDSGQLGGRIATKFDISVSDLVFSPDGKTLAAAAFGETVELIDVAAKKTRTTIPFGADNNAQAGIAGLAFSPNNAAIAVASWNGSVKLFSSAAAAPLVKLSTSHKKVIGVAFSPDGRTVATWGGAEATRNPQRPFDKPIYNPGEIILWDAAAGSQRAMLSGHPGQVGGAAFSPDGRTLVSVCSAGKIIQWDLRTARAAAVRNNNVPQDDFGPAQSGGHGVAFTPDGQALMVIGGTLAKTWTTGKGTFRQWNNPRLDDKPDNARPADVAKVAAKAVPRVPGDKAKPAAGAPLVPTRTWTVSKTKATIEAELLKIAAGTAILKKPNGTIVRIPVAALSPEDQTLIREHQ